MKNPGKTLRSFIFLAFLMTVFGFSNSAAQQVITFKSGLVVRAVILEQKADSICYQPLKDPQTIVCVPLWLVENISGYQTMVPVKDKAYWKSKVSKFTGMTIAGGTLLGLSAILVGVSVNMVNEAEFGTTQDATGVALFLVSVVGVAGGTALTIVGGANLGKAKRELRKFDMDISLNPAVRGVTLRVRF
jgi:hypothetical protein